MFWRSCQAIQSLVERRLVCQRVAGLPLVVIGRAFADILAQWQGKSVVCGICLAILLTSLFALVLMWSRNYCWSRRWGRMTIPNGAPVPCLAVSPTLPGCEIAMAAARR